MARAIAIWIFGLLASFIVGGLISLHFGDPRDAGLTALYIWGGALAGLFTFACLRLWLAAPSKNSK
jgi:hypothetical protein